MFDSHEADRKFKEATDAMLKSYAVVATGFQSIAAEAGEYSRKSLHETSAHVSTLARVDSVETVIALQADFLKSSCEGWVAEATKLGEMYLDLSKSARTPFDAPVAEGQPADIANAA